MSREQTYYMYCISESTGTAEDTEHCYPIAREDWLIHLANLLFLYIYNILFSFYQYFNINANAVKVL